MSVDKEVFKLKVKGCVVILRSLFLCSFSKNKPPLEAVE